jgi:hypothetical protein
MTMTLNWKACGAGRYTALASRIVGGKYFIEWVESRYSDEYCERYDVRSFDVDYQTKGGGSIGNVSRTSIRTLAKAKALAELHHAKLKALILEYGDTRAIPGEAWGQFSREMLEWQLERAEP